MGRSFLTPEGKVQVKDMELSDSSICWQWDKWKLNWNFRFRYKASSKGAYVLGSKLFILRAPSLIKGLLWGWQCTVTVISQIKSHHSGHCDTVKWVAETGVAELEFKPMSAAGKACVVCRAICLSYRWCKKLCVNRISPECNLLEAVRQRAFSGKIMEILKKLEGSSLPRTWSLGRW